MTNCKALLKPGNKLDWETPPDLAEYLRKRFWIDLDVCANRNNVCSTYLTKSIDGLRVAWIGRCYCNPPYGPDISDWLEHGIAQIQVGNAQIVVYLLPARTDTKWFNAFSPNSSHLGVLIRHEFIKGRLKFVGAKASATFPSMLLIMEPSYR